MFDDSGGYSLAKMLKIYGCVWKWASPRYSLSNKIGFFIGSTIPQVLHLDGCYFTINLRYQNMQEHQLVGKIPWFCLAFNHPGGVTDGDFHSHGGTPKMDSLQGKSLLRWMMTRGTPIYGNPHMAGSAKIWTVAQVEHQRELDRQAGLKDMVGLIGWTWMNHRNWWWM